MVSALFNRLFKVGIGGGDNVNINLYGSCGTQNEDVPTKNQALHHPSL
jgi:hypothetical protein